jgi:hypothetical protein
MTYTDAQVTEFIELYMELSRACDNARRKVDESRRNLQAFVPAGVYEDESEPKDVTRVERVAFEDLTAKLQKFYTLPVGIRSGPTAQELTTKVAQTLRYIKK